jgi:saccharopine dehydrogenase (NAD+, L-lysine-forming)
MNQKVLVLGLGKVGSLVGHLLLESGFKVCGLDSEKRDGLPFEVKCGDVSDAASLKSALKGCDAVVSCLPYNLNRKVVEVAVSSGVHYFDLTEDVATANHIKELAPSADCLLAPQCGLAPGFIAIVGASLARPFDTIRSIRLRVGALPQSPHGMLGYAFNWSPEGVVNQYLNDCAVIQDGEIKMVPAMQQRETLVIEGHKLEAFTTSGGLGTMCETFAGRVEELNYKTIRYQGHLDLMHFYFHEILMKNNRQLAGEILVNALPPVNKDVVYVYAAVNGWKVVSGRREHVLDEFVHAYLPRKIGGTTWRAISWTTACSLCAVVEMVFHGKLPQSGFLKQEDIPLEEFLKTRNGNRFDPEARP